MLNAFKTVDKYLSGESWVVGEDAGGVDKAKLVADLQARYSERLHDAVAQIPLVGAGRRATRREGRRGKSSRC